MNKFIIALTITVVSALAILSFTRYFDMSTCCQSAGCDTQTIVLQCAPINVPTMILHHLSIANNMTNAIFVISLTTTLFAIAFTRKLYVFIHYDTLYLKQRSRIKEKFREIGFSKSPFDYIKKLLSKGIVGSQLDFA